MQNVLSNLLFRLMTWSFKVRDALFPRRRVLEEVGLRRGMTVLDFGCGPGGYVADTADLVGESGAVFALDKHPLALKSVERIASERRLTNIKTILSDAGIGMADHSLDVVLLYDVFHGLADPGGLLKELSRALKPEGLMSFSDHHMKEDEILSGITGSGLFRLKKKGNNTYSFVKAGLKSSNRQRWHR